MPDMTVTGIPVVAPLAPPPPAGSLFSRQDLEQMKDLGKDPNEVFVEISVLRRGGAPLRLLRPCSVSDGILRLDPSEQTAARQRFEREASGRRVTKFVAASGSASRMFGALAGSLAATEAEADVAATFQRRLHEFAFFPLLRDALRRQGHNIDDLRNQNKWRAIADGLLAARGLGYGAFPKALIPFHPYRDGPRTALEEHLVEAWLYAAPPEGAVDVHFTVGSEHRDAVEAHLASAVRRFETSGLRFSSSVSVQRASTQTVPLDSNNQPLRKENGRLVFKPAGHGALLSNLNDLAGDIVFVRTVDNVLPDTFKPLVCLHKKIMGGVLLALEREIHLRLERLQDGASEVRFLDDTARFVETKLSTPLPADWPDRSAQQRRSFLFQSLNRPLRVCAVVPSDGEPGGAPFWVQDRTGSPQLRIVDLPEVNAASEDQCRIWSSATYFNPADIVCSLRSFLGKPFDLHSHQDPSSWMVVARSQQGRIVRGLERPGLWNGGMAEWNTVFLEAPRATCRPVKTVADLLDLPDFDCS
jgi:hypothetical protein